MQAICSARYAACKVSLRLAGSIIREYARTEKTMPHPTIPVRSLDALTQELAARVTTLTSRVYRLTRPLCDHLSYPLCSIKTPRCGVCRRNDIMHIHPEAGDPAFTPGQPVTIVGTEAPAAVGGERGVVVGSTGEIPMMAPVRSLWQWSGHRQPMPSCHRQISRLIHHHSINGSIVPNYQRGKSLLASLAESSIDVLTFYQMEDASA